jgi:hypothetical protein
MAVNTRQALSLKAVFLKVTPPPNIGLQPSAAGAIMSRRR